MIHSAESLILYICIVSVTGAFFVWWSRRKIFRTKTRRKTRVNKLKRFEAIKTTTPIDAPVNAAKEVAIESVENRFSIIQKLSFFLIVTVWLIALIFPFLNSIPATFVSILVTASAVVIGIAARPFIENLISGIVITYSRLIRIGDTVIIDNKYGTIEDITITHTVVKMWDWRRYVIPNERMLAKEIINYTINDAYQWVHVEFVVAYDSDLEIIKELAMDAASGSNHFADYEEPSFWIMDMEEKGYKCWIAAWADSPIDAWELGNDIRTELIRKFKSNGIKTHKFELGYLGK